MIYRSTRSEHRASAPEAVLQGIAPDGGLYVPESFPDFDWQGCLRCPPTEISARVLAALLPGCGDAEGLVDKAYFGKFSTPLLCPLERVGGLWSLELYHGPTSAFKDVALSVLPRLISEARRSSGIETMQNTFETHAMPAPRRQSLPTLDGNTTVLSPVGMTL